MRSPEKTRQDENRRGQQHDRTPEPHFRNDALLCFYQNPFGESENQPGRSTRQVGDRLVHDPLVKHGQDYDTGAADAGELDVLIFEELRYFSHNRTLSTEC